RARRICDGRGSPRHVGKAWPVKVRYIRRAIRQMTDILDYLEARSPQGAESVKRRLKAAIDVIADHPKNGRPPIRPTSAASWQIRTLMSSSTVRTRPGLSFTGFAIPPVARVKAAEASVGRHPQCYNITFCHGSTQSPQSQP